MFDNTINMRFTVDNSDSDIICVDNSKLLFAKSPEIIRIRNHDKTNGYRFLSRLITMCYDLPKTVEDALYTIYINQGEYLKDIKDVYLDAYKVSDVTFGRAIKALESKRVIHISADNVVEIDSRFAISDVTNDIAKLIVIELNNNN